MPKYIHRAKTLPAIPMDYKYRFDFSNAGERAPTRVHYLTNAATNDVDQIWDETGRGTLVDISVATTYPALTTDADGLPCLHFSGDGGLRNTFTDLHAANSTYFFVYRTAFASGSYLYTATTPCGVFMVNRHSINTNSINVYINGTATDGYSTNNFNDRRAVVNFTLTHNATNNNDIAAWLGKTAINSATALSDANVSASYITFGCASAGTQEALDTDLYEVIIYDRVLSTPEREATIDYLSNKWSVSNADNASDTISAGSTAEVWTNSSIDPDGNGVLTNPGKQTGEYSLVPLGDRDAPKVAGSNKFDDSFPINEFGAGLVYWFRPDVTNGMTFATGDAKSGGTVSSWTDITGAETMNTTQSGDAAVTYHPNISGYPAIEGGNSTTPRALRTGIFDLLFNNAVGSERILWAVCSFGDSSGGTVCTGSLQGVQIWPEARTDFFGDLYPGQGVPCMTAAGGSYPASVRHAGERHVMVWRITNTTASDGDVEQWYGGMKLPDKLAVATAGTSQSVCSVGALSNSSRDANGSLLFEMGATSSATGYTDTQVDDLIRHLCNKYNVDYMSDTTPLDIGLHARSTISIAQTDCALWWRSDEGLSESAWALHPLCAALHTNPATMTMVDTAANVLGPGEIAMIGGRKAFQSFATVNYGYGLVSGNYNWVETTDFPAPDNGGTGLVVGTIDNDSANAYPYLVTFGNIGSMRRFNSSPTLVQIFVGNLSTSVGNAIDNHILCGNTYEFDEGDATPGGDYILDSVRGSVTGDPAYTSFGNIVTTIGLPTSTTLNGKCKVSEMFLWKHPLTAAELANVVKYVRYRYNSTFPQ